MDWQPMTTAPKDGTPIVFLYGDASGSVVVTWNETMDGFCNIFDAEDYVGLADDGYWAPLPEVLVASALHWRDRE